jgi:hypothetical protein
MCTKAECVAKWLMFLTPVTLTATLRICILYFVIRVVLSLWFWSFQQPFIHIVYEKLLERSKPQCYAATFGFSSARVRLCLEDFGWAGSRSDDEPSGGYALHYKSLYERNFVKRGLTVQYLTYPECIFSMHGKAAHLFSGEEIDKSWQNHGLLGRFKLSESVLELCGSKCPSFNKL